MAFLQAHGDRLTGRHRDRGGAGFREIARLVDFRPIIFWPPRVTIDPIPERAEAPVGRV